MKRLLVVFVSVAAASMGCGTNTSSSIPERPREMPVAVVTTVMASSSTAILVPENPADRGIRRDLDSAISRDTELHDREISFIVANGDVSVIGTVRSEKERRKINGLAFEIGGVKSVANALRVAE